MITLKGLTRSSFSSFGSLGDKVDALNLERIIVVLLPKLSKNSLP